MMQDFLIIGGGLIGMLAARELRAGGATVAVLDRGPLGREASWAGGGILSPLYPWRYPRAVTELARWSQREYPRLVVALEEESGIDPEWTTSGMLILDVTERDAALAWGERFGVRMLPRSLGQLREQVPGLAATLLNSAADSALWLPDIAQVRNPRLLKALGVSLANSGVQVHEGVAASGLLVEQGRIAGVRTLNGDVRGGNVVVAGGAWSAALLRTVGVSLALAPVRGQMMLFRAAPGLLGHMLMQRHRYLIPRRDGHILAGSTLEQVGFDKSTTEAAALDLRAAAFNLLPELARCPVELQWAGLRPGTPTGVPLIGPHPDVSGLYVCTGHYRNGVVLGPASARLLADLALGRSPCLDPRSYAYST